MPIIKSAIKRAKQTLVRRARNQSTKKDIKAAVKAFEAKPSATTLSQAQSAIDIAVKKHILEKRTAARRKSALSQRAKVAGVKLATGTTKKTAAKAAPAPSKTTKVASASAKKAAATAPKTKKSTPAPKTKKTVVKKPATTKSK